MLFHFKGFKKTFCSTLNSCIGGFVFFMSRTGYQFHKKFVDWLLNTENSWNYMMNSFKVTPAIQIEKTDGHELLCNILILHDGVREDESPFQVIMIFYFKTCLLSQDLKPSMNFLFQFQESFVYWLLVLLAKHDCVIASLVLMQLISSI